MMSRRLKERIGAGVAALAFLLVFGGVGFGAFYVIYGTIRDGLRAEDWVRVRADIQRVEPGTVTYSYEWNEKKHFGDRAGTFILGGNSDVDDWDDRMEAIITAAQEQKKPITVFVNPDNPAESMIDREIRWKLLLIALPFGLGFGGGGLAAAFFIGRTALGIKESGGSVPWLRPRTREALWQWAVGIVWNGVSAPIALIAIPSLWAQGEWFPIILLAIFPLFGILILWSAISSTVGAFREGFFNSDSARTA